MRAAVFDMDGLMFDTERVFVQAWDAAGEAMGIGPAGFMVMKTLGLKIADSLAVWRAAFGDGFDEDALRRHTKAFLRDYYAANGVPVKPGLRELLADLDARGFLLAVASSTPAAEVRAHLDATGVAGYFRAVIGGDMVAHSKPAPDSYLAACAALDVPPAQVYALEDSRNGLWAAHAAGCRPIMVPDLWAGDPATDGIIYVKAASLLELVGRLTM